MKKTILHIIDDLGRGGAERMLITVTSQLSEYNNIIVTLYPRNDFAEEITSDKIHCLNLSSRLLIPFAATRLRKIIKQNKVDLVHSHLFWSSVVARLGTPKKIPLVTTIHGFVASSIEYSPWHMRLTERITYNFRKSIIVAVAKKALEEYFAFIKVKPHKAKALYTFVDVDVFNKNGITASANNGNSFRLITVGNLKIQKNHTFLLEAFKQLKEEHISLDIYGEGVLHESLQKVIDENRLNITLKGQVKNIQQLIPQYDLFVMSSSYEGFALSVLEAMAMGMPMLLSNILSFDEQCADTAVFFDLNSPDDFINKLKMLVQDKEQLSQLGQNAKQRVLDNFTLQHHLAGLRAIYADALNQQ